MYSKVKPKGGVMDGSSSGKPGEKRRGADGEQRPDPPAPETVSLGKRLRKSMVPCLGINANWSDYSEEDRRRILGAGKICYPGPVYEGIFLAAGKECFPKNYYHFLGNKIAQTNLFQLLDIPHPRTRIYYGRKRQNAIEDEFGYPFLGKTPVGSSQGKGVFLIGGPDRLAAYLAGHNPAYIQEFLPIDRDLRAVVIGGHVVHAYWRIHREGNFRNNVAQGGAISFMRIPEEALRFARHVAHRCGFDEAGLDICEYQGTWYVIEANMAFGVEGFRQRGLDINETIGALFDSGVIG